MNYRALVPAKIDILLLPLLILGFLALLNISPIPYMVYDDWVSYLDPNDYLKYPAENGRWITLAYIMLFSGASPYFYKTAFVIFTVLGGYIWARQFLETKNPFKIVLVASLIFLCPIVMLLSKWPFICLPIPFITFTYAVCCALFPRHKLWVLLGHCFIGQMTYNLMPFYFLFLYLVEADFNRSYKKLFLTLTSFYAVFAFSVLVGSALSYFSDTGFGLHATRATWRLLKDPITLDDLFFRIEVFINMTGRYMHILKPAMLGVPLVAVWLFFKDRFAITALVIAGIAEIIFVFCIQYYYQIKFPFRSSPDLWIIFIAPLLIAIKTTDLKLYASTIIMSLILVGCMAHEWHWLYNRKEDESRFLSKHMYDIKERSKGLPLFMHIKRITNSDSAKNQRLDRYNDMVLLDEAPEHVRHNNIRLGDFSKRFEYVLGSHKVGYCRNRCKGVSADDFSKPFLKGNEIIFKQGKAHILIEVQNKHKN